MKPFFAYKCLENEIPFNKLNDTEFESFLKYEVLKSENSINIRPNTSPAQQTIINKINNLIEQSNCINGESDSEYGQQIPCNYYSSVEFIKAGFQSSKNVAILHLNIHSIQLHIEELRIILGTLDYMFDSIAISESKLKNDPKVDISLKGYHPPYCTNTEAEKGCYYFICDPSEVNLLINQLNPSKSSGPNGIPTKIMQMISNIICVPLSKIYNIPIPIGTHPDKFKNANVYLWFL